MTAKRLLACCIAMCCFAFARTACAQFPFFAGTFFGTTTDVSNFAFDRDGQYSAEFYVPDSPRTGDGQVAIVVQLEAASSDPTFSPNQELEAGVYWNGPGFPNQWSAHVCWRYPKEGLGVVSVDCGAGFPVSVNEKISVDIYPSNQYTMRLDVTSDVGVCWGSCQRPYEEFRLIPLNTGVTVREVRNLVWATEQVSCDQLPSSNFVEFKNETLLDGWLLITPAWSQLTVPFYHWNTCALSNVIHPTSGQIFWDTNHPW